MMTIIQMVKKKKKQIQMLLPVQPQTNGAKKNAFRCQIKTNGLLDYHFLLKKIVKWKLSFEKCVVTG